MRSAIVHAKRTLVPSDNGDRISIIKLQNTAFQLQESIRSVVSAGLPKSNLLIEKANQFDQNLHDMGSKVS